VYYYLVFVPACSTSLLYIQSRVLITVSQARKAQLALIGSDNDCIVIFIIDIVYRVELLLHSSFHYIQASDLYCYTGHKGPACQFVLVMFVFVIFHC